MSQTPHPELSIVVPIYNEGRGLAAFHRNLVDCLHKTVKLSYEIIYCNDGSTDETVDIITKLRGDNPSIKLVSFSRNFGKEIATTAGIHEAKGQAIITLDGDGQHPMEIIPKLIADWKLGNKVVVGVCVNNRHSSGFRRQSSKLFYKLFNRFTGATLVPGSTDLRLIDQSVQQDFIRMTERSRITRGLIDWLGYKRSYIEFTANPRLAGDATYSSKQLFKLAIDSVVSLSSAPLYATVYVGAVVLPTAAILGTFMIINAILSDPLNLHITGSAYVVTLLLFLVGMLLVSQGIIGLYISHIHTETQNRPLFVIDQEKSLGLVSKTSA